MYRRCLPRRCNLSGRQSLPESIGLKGPWIAEERRSFPSWRLWPKAGCDDNEGRMTSPDEPLPEKPVISPLDESLDQPLDALVYEVHPAFTPRGAAAAEYSPDYPY